MVKRAVSYSEVEGLAGYYFEDSYVLGICILPDELSFDLEVVLTESHPEYSRPPEEEMYCYRRGQLKFSGVHKIDLVNVRSCFSIDANGEKDMGSIDGINVDENGAFHVFGPWGEVRLHSTCVSVNLV